MPKMVGDVRVCEALLHCSVDTQWSKCIVQIASSPKHIHGPEAVCSVVLKRLWGVHDIFEWIADSLQGVPPAPSATATLAQGDAMEKFNTAIQRCNDMLTSEELKLESTGTLAVLASTRKDVCDWAVSTGVVNNLFKLLNNEEKLDMVRGNLVVALASIVSQVSNLESKEYVVKLLQCQQDLLEKMAQWGRINEETITLDGLSLKCVSRHAQILMGVVDSHVNRKREDTELGSVEESRKSRKSRKSPNYMTLRSNITKPEHAHGMIRRSQKGI